MWLICGCIKRILKLFLYLTIFVVAVLLIPNLPPYTQFKSIELEPAQPRTGALAPNDVLNNPEKLYKGKLYGPEAFDVHNGEVYTGLATGEIVKLSPGGHMTFVAKLGKPCAGLHEVQLCGRPLGLQIDKTNSLLYVVDAYYGVWKIDLKTNKKEQLVSPNVELNGKVHKFYNDLAVDNNGDIYWTVSSTDFEFKDGAHAVLMDPSGRLMHYNAAKKVTTVLADNLGFPNGVVLSPDNQFVLVVETMLLKVTKIYIKGPKKGTSEVFISGLPGTPDNIRALPDGSGVLLALYTVYDDDHPLITRSLMPLPYARKFLVRTALMIENLFDFLNRQIPHPVFESVVDNLGSFKYTSNLLSGNAGLLQIDWNGNIVASYFSTDKNVTTISDAIVVNDKLWIGSPHSQDYIAAFPVPPLLKKAFAIKPTAESKTKEKVVEKIPVNEKVVENKAAPKTTTPPPTEAPKAKQPLTQPPKPTTPQQPEKKPLDNKEQKTKPKETPKKNVDSKATEAKPNKDTVKPPAPKESDAKKKIVTETKPKVGEEKVKIEKPKTDAASQNKPSSAETKKAPQPPKPAAASNTEAKKTPQVPKSATPPKTESKKPPQAPKAAKKPIPVVEDIPSDTVKPSKDKLKVITKSGPNEIPNPNL